MPLFESLYAAGMVAARSLAPSVASRDSKIGRGVRGRQSTLGSLQGWTESRMDPERPRIWIHAPSVGEGLQARAVVEAVAARAPGRLQWMFTHFSPSAEPLARRMPVDWAGYLPWDVESEMTRALALSRPDLVVFTKTEVWPVLSRTAAVWGIPTALVAATLPESSSRTGFPARPVLRPSMERLALVAAIADADADRFRALGVRPEALVVTGDPGIDSAASRAEATDGEASHLRPFRDGRPTLVAGSTWPADEAVLLPAAASFRARSPHLRLILAPHEPEPAHVGSLVAALRGDGWTTATLAEVETEGSAEGVDAVVVDRVGVLAALYTVGAVAFVGGGFHDAGLHSVLEPAAAGIPSLFGPAHDNARAASALVAEGAAREVAGVEALEDALAAWLGEPEAGRAAGSAARRWIDRHRGAADRTAAALLRLMSP